MRSPPTELSPSRVTSRAVLQLSHKSTGWPRYLGQGRAGRARTGISLLALTSSLPANKPQHRLRDEPRAEQAATRDGAIQGHKIRSIAKTHC